MFPPPTKNRRIFSPPTDLPKWGESCPPPPKFSKGKPCIVRLNNIVFTHDTINAKTPPIFESYFIFNKTSHQHETVNSLNSIYSLPTGSLKLPAYRTESGKSSIRFICSSTWNTILKDISIKNINKYNKDHFWMNKTNIKTLKHILHKHFLEYY